MLNLKQLAKREDSLKKSLDTINKTTKVNVSSYYKQSNYLKGYTKSKEKPKVIKGSILNVIPKGQRALTLQNATDQVETIKQVLNNRFLDFDFREKEIIKAQLEYQRKYTLAFSCLLLFFIGAPLGAIIRKGGLGLPVVIAIAFFLIYHIISTVAEKSAKEGSLDPVFAMWTAIVVLTPLGAFLTYKATIDSALFDLNAYKQFVVGLFKRKKDGI